MSAWHRLDPIVSYYMERTFGKSEKKKSIYLNHDLTARQNPDGCCCLNGH